MRNGFVHLKHSQAPFDDLPFQTDIHPERTKMHQIFACALKAHCSATAVEASLLGGAMTMCLAVSAQIPSGRVDAPISSINSMFMTAVSLIPSSVMSSDLGRLHLQIFNLDESL
jgi:hypothetical protein